MTLGDERWEAARGRISAAERFRYTLSVVGAQLELLVRKFARKPLGRVELDRVVYPDSACAKVAVEQVRELASPAVVNHSFRTYVWGSLLGQLDGQRWDEEILFVTSMVHDLGFTPSLHGTCPGARCFTLDGVHGAARIFAETSDERAARMRRAVLLHLNVHVQGALHGWEAHYLQAGASLDVVGQRYAELPRDARNDTLERYPRLQLKAELDEWIRREARLRPDSRFAVLDRLGFRGVMRRTPFAS